MNAFNFGRSWRGTWRAAVVFALVLAGGVRADEPQADEPQVDGPQAARYLFIFETSPAFKRNLPAIRETLDKLFASNLQNEIKTDDDVAVWTVDKELHTAAFPLANWVPDEAGIYADRLNSFLHDQPTSRHASLAAIQPLLNRVVKDSRSLTVLIVGDTQSRLVGTPYDDGVNEIITNAASRIKGPVTPFIIVLRAYHGQYLGCSVNRTGALNFPRFPLPKPPAMPVAVPPPPPPVVKTGPSIIIVGNQDESHVPALKSAAVAPPVPALVPPPTPAPKPAPAPLPTHTVIAPPANTAPKIVAAAPPANPKPAPVASLPPVTPPAPVPAVAPVVPSVPPPGPPSAPTIVAPAPVKVTPVVAVAPAAPVPAATPPVPPVVAVVPPPAATSGLLLPLALAAVALLAVAVIVLALVIRARRPTGSLITSSMEQDRKD